MTTTRNDSCHARPQRPGPGTPACAAPARPSRGGRAWLWTGRPKPTAPPGILAGGGCPRRGAWRRTWLAALAVFGLVAGAAAQASLSADPNPSSDGAYTVSWTAITGATKYQLLEDGTLSYEGTSLSKAYTGKAAGSYEYTLTYCVFVPFPSPTTVCNLPSNYTAVTVTVSDGTVTPTPPSAPTLTVPADDDDGAYEVSWSDPEDAETFELEEQVDDGAWGSVYSGTANSKTFTGKGTGVYGYRVKACDDADDCSAWSATESVQVTRTSSTLSASPNPAPGGDYTVSWSASVLSSTYRLDESVDGAAATEVYSGTGLSKSFTGRDPGSYAYSLKVCFSLLGSTVCVPSGSVTVSVPEPEPSGSISASPSPCIIPAGESRCTTTVTWSTEDADSPCIFMSGSQARFACGASGSKDAPWIGTAGATFLLKAGNTFSTDTLDSVTVNGELAPPAVPTLTVPANDIDGAYTVSWTSPTGATRFHLDQKVDTGDWLSNYRGTDTSRAYTGKRDGTYMYRVRACIGADPCSDWSPAESVRVLLTPGVPGAITGPSEDTDGTYTLSWGASTGTVDDYELQRRKDSGSWAERQKGSARTVNEIDLSDGIYVYRVRACNALSCGGFTAEKEVDVDSGTTPMTGVPEMPAAPRVTADGSTGLDVDWDEPADNGSAITGYDVEYRVDGDTNWTDHPFTGTGTSTTIGGLTPDTTYEVRVRAQNGEGESDWSPIGEGTTPVQGVPDAPDAPEVTADGSTGLDVDWDEPADNGSAITGYDVEYRVDGDTNWTDHPFTGTGTSTTIGGLTPDTTYEVRVRAANDEGESGWSPIERETTDDVVPETPAAPAVTPADSMSLDVDWREPVSRGSAITDYDVEYRVDGATNWTDHPFMGTGTSTTIGGLTPDTAYEVRVRAQNGEGESDWSPTGEGTTPVQGVPDAPEAPEVTADGSTGLDVDWDAPADNGSAITGYDVEYRVDGDTNWTGHPFTGTGTSTTIGGLAPDTAYEVRVRAANGAGDGPWSSSGTATTGADTANTAPNAADDTATTAPGTAVIIDVLANDSDADGDPLSIDAVDDPADQIDDPDHGAVTVNSDDTLTYTPDAGYTGSDSFDYTVSDGEATDTATVTVLVSAVASQLSAMPNPSATGNYTVRWTASTLGSSYVLNESNDGGSTWTQVYSGSALEHAITGKTDGTYHYRLSACFTNPVLGGTTCLPAAGPYPVRVEIMPPPGVPGAIGGPSHSSGWHTLNWAAASGMPTRYELQEQRESDGWVTVVDADVLRAELTERIAGAYLYRVRACKLDLCGAFTATKSVRVNRALDARPNPSSDGNYEVYWTPVSGSSRYQLLEDGTIVHDGPRPSHRVTGKAPGTYHYTVERCIAVNIPGLPAEYCNIPLYSTPLPVTVIALPTATDDTATTLPNVAVTIDVLANDSHPDGDPLSIDSLGNPANGTAAIVGGQIAYTPDTNYVGTDGFDYTITDGTNTATATVTVIVNTPPSAVDDTATTTPNTAVTIDVLANDSDADGDPLSIDSVDDPANGAAAIVGGQIAYTPDTDFEGTDTFDYTVSDGKATRTATAAVTVSTPPTGSISANPETCAIPAEQSRCTSTIDWSTSHATTACVFVSTSQARFACGLSGSKDAPWITRTGATFLLKAGNTFDSPTLDSVFVQANTPPTAVDDEAITPPNTAVTIDVLANDSDADGDTLHIDSVDDPANGSTAIVSGAIVYNPDTDYEGTDTFDYTVSDNTHTATATVTVTVTGPTMPNTPPDATDDAATTTPNTAVTIDVLANDSDADNDTLTVAAVDDPADQLDDPDHGSATVVSVVVNQEPVDQLRYDPDPGYVGTDVFDYTASDGTDTATATVTVTVNTPPTAANDAAQTAFETAVTIDVLANDGDADGQALSIDSVDDPANGAAAINGTRIDYEPDAGFLGTDTFDYRVRDTYQAERHATVTVRVHPAVPGSLRTEPLGPDRYTLAWDAVAGTGIDYELEEELTGGTGPDTHTAPGTQKAFAGQADGEYRYRVRACAANANCGDWSASVAVTVPLPPPAPENLDASTPNADGGLHRLLERRRLGQRNAHIHARGAHRPGQLEQRPRRPRHLNGGHRPERRTLRLPRQSLLLHPYLQQLEPAYPGCHWNLARSERTARNRAGATASGRSGFRPGRRHLWGVSRHGIGGRILPRSNPDGARNRWHGAQYRAGLRQPGRQRASPVRAFPSMACPPLRDAARLRRRTAATTASALTRATASVSTDNGWWRWPEPMAPRTANTVRRQTPTPKWSPRAARPATPLISGCGARTAPTPPTGIPPTRRWKRRARPATRFSCGLGTAWRTARVTPSISSITRTPRQASTASCRSLTQAATPRSGSNTKRAPTRARGTWRARNSGTASASRRSSPETTAWNCGRTN